MAIADLTRYSKVLSDKRISDYIVISHVDGGFLFVFWWRIFLDTASPQNRFSRKRTPIYGVTKVDEYYPATSMAGNIAYITNTIPGMIYPHNVIALPKMDSEDLNGFYTEFSKRAGIPTFHKRVLFVGRIDRDLQYTIPFILHEKDSYQHIYDPLRLRWNPKGTFESFYRVFGYYPQNDIIIVR